MKIDFSQRILIYSFTFLSLLLAMFIACNVLKGTQSVDQSSADSLPQPALLYGIPVDSFDISSAEVMPGESIGSILSEYNFPGISLQEIIDTISKVVNVHKIQTGTSYTVFLTRDSAFLTYFVYEPDPFSYLRIDLNAITAQWVQKEVRNILKSASGKITISLWNTISEQQINPLVALELSDIYAWTVDFFALDKGDEFRVIYDEQYVDSVSVGIGRIYAAWFLHRGRPYYAIPFIQNGEERFFDLEGNSLRKTFLKAPLRFSRITSRFSNSRFHPVLKIRRPHHGVDYAAPVGTPVHAIGDGVINEAGWHSGSGNILKIRHNSIYTTGYMHLRNFAKGIHQGVKIQQGQVIGYVGTTGLSTGPHLDFRFYKNGHAINPLKVESPPAEPVKQKDLQAFDSIASIWSVKLDSLGRLQCQ